MCVLRGPWRTCREAVPHFVAADSWAQSSEMTYWLKVTHQGCTIYGTQFSLVRENPLGLPWLRELAHTKGVRAALENPHSSLNQGEMSQLLVLLNS